MAFNFLASIVYTRWAGKLDEGLFEPVKLVFVGYIAFQTLGEYKHWMNKD